MGSIVWAQGLTQAVIATSSMEWNGKQCKEYPTATYLTPILVEREREGIIVYKGTSHSSKHKSPEHRFLCLVDLTLNLDFKTLNKYTQGHLR